MEPGSPKFTNKAEFSQGAHPQGVAAQYNEPPGQFVIIKGEKSRGRTTAISPKNETVDFIGNYH